MSINIQKRVLDTLFDIAVEEKGVCEDMDRAYNEWYQFWLAYHNLIQCTQA